MNRFWTNLVSAVVGSVFGWSFVCICTDHWDWRILVVAASGCGFMSNLLTPLLSSTDKETLNSGKEKS